MVGDLFHTGRRHPPAAEDVGEERTDIVETLWTAEGNDENGVEHQ